MARKNFGYYLAGGVILTSCIAALGLNLGSPGSRSRDTPAPQRGPLSTKVGKSSEFKALETRLSALEKSTAVRPKARPRPTGEDTGPKERPSLIEAAEENNARRYLHGQRLDTLLVEETRDTQWANTMEDNLENSMTTERFKGNSMASVACGATVCRIEIDHDNAEAREGFPTAMMGSEFTRTGAGIWAREVETDGQLKTFLYLAREGHADLLTPGRGEDT